MFHVTVLPGDGIGPEITQSAVNVLKAADELFQIELSFSTCDFGGISLDRHGVPVQEGVLAACRSSDAVLLGAVGGPAWDQGDPALRPEAALLRLRSEMNAFANLRPVKLYPALQDASPLKNSLLEQGIDLLIIRELLGGIYFGKRGTAEAHAFDTEQYDTVQIERIVRKAFSAARGRRGKLCLVDKANVLESSRLWRKLFFQLADDYPEVEVSALYVDNAAMQLIRRPFDFDCIVTSNLFGDILSDEAAVLTGSIGMLPSASLDENGRGIYEPIHGSAPDIAGTGQANPIGTILSAAMLLRYSLKEELAARCVEAAVYAAVQKGYRTADIYTDNTTLVNTKEMEKVIIHEMQTFR